MNARKFVLFSAIAMITSLNVYAQIQIGIFADCQYCDCPTSGSRHYRNSLFKLKACIRHFNHNEQVAFVVGLGDLIDRDFRSFKSLEPILEKSVHPVYHVTGNHDFDVDKSLLEKVPEALGITQTYHSFEMKGWLFIFLDGNEITLQSNDPQTVRQAEKILLELDAGDKPNNKQWNGGMSRKQIDWLDTRLQQAEVKNQQVALFCHYPILPLEAHALWNAEEIMSLLEKYDHVKLWMNGHNHAGNYAFRNGIHFVTLKGMVETENENAFATIALNQNSIEIFGHGREEYRKLDIKQETNR